MILSPCFVIKLLCFNVSPYYLEIIGYHYCTMFQYDNVLIWQLLLIFSGFAKMSNIESINLSIKIDGKAIDVTYKGWTEIHQLIHECNDNEKKPTWMLTRNIFVLLLPCIFFQQDLIQSSSSYPSLQSSLGWTRNRFIFHL